MANSKIRFEIQEGEHLETIREHTLAGDVLILDDLCQKFLDFLDAATYCNNVEIIIKDRTNGDVVLKNNPRCG